jgi:hypothetical protein
MTQALLPHTLSGSILGVVDTHRASTGQAHSPDHNAQRFKRAPPKVPLVPLHHAGQRDSYLVSIVCDSLLQVEHAHEVQLLVNGCSSVHSDATHAALRATVQCKVDPRLRVPQCEGVAAAGQHKLAEELPRRGHLSTDDAVLQFC